MVRQVESIVSMEFMHFLMHTYTYGKQKYIKKKKYLKKTILFMNLCNSFIAYYVEGNIFYITNFSHCWRQRARRLDWQESVLEEMKREEGKDFHFLSEKRFSLDLGKVSVVDHQIWWVNKNVLSTEVNGLHVFETAPSLSWNIQSSASSHVSRTSVGRDHDPFPSASLLHRQS